MKLVKEKEKHDFSFGEWDKLSSNSTCQEVWSVFGFSQ